MIKKTLVFIFYFLLLFEFFSFLSSKLNLLSVNQSPTYSNNSIDGLNWRNEFYSWGAWHKKHATDKHISACFNIDYRSNDIGSRDNDNYLTIDSSNNVVVIGDSFVEGYGVSLEDTFTNKLLNKYGKKGLNFGSSGDNGPVSHYLIYKQLASKIPHNEVVYFLFPYNDFSDNDFRNADLFGNRYRPYFKQTDGKYLIKYPKLSKPSESYNGGSDILKSIRRFLVNYTWSANTIRSVKSLVKGKILENKSGYFINEDVSVGGTLFFINKLMTAIPSDYKKTIMIIPSIDDLNNIKKNGWSYKELPWYKDLKKISKNNEFIFIDLALDFKNNQNYEYVDDLLINSYLQCDPHWNKYGNKNAINIFLGRRNK